MSYLGEWIENIKTGGIVGFYGSNYRFAAAGASDTSAIYALNIPEDGSYAVTSNIKAIDNVFFMSILI